MEGPPPPSSYWTLQPENPPGTEGVTLAVDDHILHTYLAILNTLEPRLSFMFHSQHKRAEHQGVM